MQEDNIRWDWDSQIEDDGQDVSSYTLLEPGVYGFEVVDAMRSRHEARPGGKIPSCPKMELTVKLMGKDGQSSLCKDSLFLCAQMKFKLVKFFICIGDMKPGETLVPKWDELVGKRGMAKVGVRNYTSKEGEQRQANQLEEYLSPTKKEEEEIPF